MGQKVISYQNIHTTINKETNKVTSQTTTSKIKVDKEPNYVKLYLDDICLLNNLPKTSSAILNELLLCSNYNNEISLSRGIKNRIAKDLDVTNGHLDNTISKLSKFGILKKIDVGLYVLNPFIFGRGNWLEIKSIRATWKYSDKGRELDIVGLDFDDELSEEVTQIGTKYVDKLDDLTLVTEPIFMRDIIRKEIA